MNKKVDALHSCESTCHECTSKDEFKKYNEDIVVEKKELFMRKDWKKRK